MENALTSSILFHQNGIYRRLYSLTDMYDGEASRLRPASRLSQSVSRAACCSGGAAAEPSAAANQGLLTSMNTSHRSYCQNAYAACIACQTLHHDCCVFAELVLPCTTRSMSLVCPAMTASPSTALATPKCAINSAHSCALHMYGFIGGKQ